MNNETDFNTYIELAEQYYYSDLYKRAEQFYKKALIIKDLDADSYYRLSMCYLDIDLIEEAKIYILKAYELYPTNESSLRNYADFLFNYENKRKDAEQLYFKLLDLYPNKLNLYLNLDNIYFTNDSEWSPNFEKRKELLKKGIKIFPSSNSIFETLFRLLTKHSPFNEIQKFFNKLLKNEKITFNYYQIYANYLIEKGESDALIRVMLACISILPREVKIYKQLINIYSDNNELELVISTYEQLFKIEYDELNNYYKLAEYLLEKGELNKAMNYYEIAAKINSSKVLFKQAVTISNPPFEYYSKTIGLYKEVLELNPSNHKAYCNMGVCSGYLQQHHESLNYYTKAIEINPFYDLPYENSGNAYRRAGDLDQAITSYKKALKLNPENYRAATNLGVTYYSLGKYKKALKYYKISIEHSSNQHIQTYYNLALLYNKLKKYKKAIDASQKALDLYNDNTDPRYLFNKYAIYYTLGRSNYFLNKKEESLNYFFKSLELNKNYKDTYVFIGGIYNDLDKLDLAKEYLTKALKLDPLDFCALEKLGWSYFLEKDYEEALIYSKKSATINPENADIFYNLGKIYSSLKNKEKAKKKFKKAAKLGNEDAKKLIEEALK